MDDGIVYVDRQWCLIEHWMRSIVHRKDNTRERTPSVSYVTAVPKDTQRDMEDLLCSSERLEGQCALDWPESAIVEIDNQYINGLHEYVK